MPRRLVILSLVLALLGPLAPTAPAAPGASLQTAPQGQPPAHNPLTLSEGGGAAVMATTVSAGASHTCAGTTDGVKCWGLNSNGQLGDGTTSVRHTPVDVVGLTSAVASLSAGDYHTCVVTASGGAKCWGNKVQLGIDEGGKTYRSEPVDVSGLTTGMASISAGARHTCAVTASGGAKCWGWNEHAQLGDGTTEYWRLTPVDVVGMGSGLAAMGLGWIHTCAVTTSGALKCWGNNGYGLVTGIRTGGTYTTPVDVAGLGSGVAAVSAGHTHNCVVTTSGGVRCWGRNAEGQVGDGTTEFARWTPVNVVGLGSGVAAISAGLYHTCAVTASGGVKCWGANDYGQLGDGTTLMRNTPVDVKGLSGVVAVEAGAFHTCAVTVAGGVWCWGYNGSGQLGDGTTTDRHTPVLVEGLEGGAHIEITQGIQDIGNSVPLIAGKPTVARVYYGGSCDSGSSDPLVITLQAYGADGAELGGSPLSRTVSPHTASLRQARADAAKTANFALPLGWLQGSVTLVARLGTEVGASTVAQFRPASSPRVTYVPLRYGNATPSPRIRTAFRFAQQVWPVSRVDYRPSPTIDWRPSLLCHVFGNACLANDLKRRLNKLHEQMATPGYLFGWLPESTDLGGLQGLSDPPWLTHPDGRTGGGVVAFGIDHPGDGPTIMAHELAHNMGRRHTNGYADPLGQCGNPDLWGQDPSQSPDHDWPYATAGIQEWGAGGTSLPWLWRSAGMLKDPATHYDYMSYCWLQSWEGTPAWTSPHTYQRLHEGALSTAGAPAQLQAAPERGILASGLVFAADDEVLLDPLLVITTTHAVNDPGGAGDYCLEALDASDAVLAGRCFSLAFTDMDTGEFTGVDAFTLSIPYPDGLARVILRKGADLLAEQGLSPQAPELTLVHPVGGEAWSGSGSQTIRWTGADADDDPLTYSVFYSPDGVTWAPVALDLEETEVGVEAGELAGGDAARVRVVATDGLHTVTAESGAFSVGGKAPWAAILAPEGDGYLGANTSMLLQGHAYDLEDGALAEDALGWTSSLQGALGGGGDVWVILAPGVHTITLTATDSDGNRAEASVQVVVSGAFLPAILRE